MPKEKEFDIYRSRAEEYERLVAREDYEGNLLPALKKIIDLDGRIVVDLGTGTGRLIKLLAPEVAVVHGFDNSPAMLGVARRELQAAPINNWSLSVGDHRFLPIENGSCDLIISGWSLAYLAQDQGPHWRVGLRLALRRMQQKLRPGGSIIIIETQGTGFTSPNPPPFLLEYFDFLEEIGMESTWIRTDYQFISLEEAVDLIHFFFGDELANQVKSDGSPIVPECTGIWWSSDASKLNLAL